MRTIPVITLLLVIRIAGFSQTNINGVINSYHRVVEVITAKACVRVDNTSGLTAGDMVMMVQMKGATVNTTNTSSFGSVTAMNNAGNYEINFICAIRADSVFFYKQIQQPYTVADKVQLVRVPQYASALVTDTLKALPWDNTTGKGGVLALSVSDDLILNAPISANDAGYSGGLYATSSTSCTNFFAASNYYYNANVLSPQDGAFKGESISDLSVTYSGGKGAVASGGGGGNNHNNGGGGGSNSAAGGKGGNNSSTSGCTVANAGLGGYALNNSAGSKIFLGGGGGAGHANSGFASTGGGSGGGILFVQANTVYSNGHKIKANGRDGGNTIGDGASGGGGGGTIIFDVNIFSGALNAEAIGGKGGNEDDDFTSGKCYGEGGGGSGGMIYFKSTLPAGTISVAGGLKGNRINSISCGAIPSAVNGTGGSIITSYSYIQSTTLSASCTGALATGLVSFRAISLSGHIRIEWQVSDPGHFQNFTPERRTADQSWKPLATITSDGRENYDYLDEAVPPGIYQYRLKLAETDGSQLYSGIRQVKIGDTRMKLLLFPNPAQKMVTIPGSFRAGTEIRIFDDKGRKVFERKLATTESDIRQNISFLEEGIYYVQVAELVERLVIVRH